jgi:hypothetical protein
LIKVEPYKQVLRGAMGDESQLMNATLGIRDSLLKRLTCAIIILDGLERTNT